MAVNNAQKRVVYRRDNGGFDYYGDNNKRRTIYRINDNITVKDNPFDQRRFGRMKLGRNSDGSIYYTGTFDGSTYKFFDNGRVANTKTGLMGRYSSAPGSNKFKFTWDTPAPQTSTDNSSVVNNSDERPGITNMKELVVTAPRYITARGFDRNKMQPDAGVGPITIPSIEQPNLEGPNILASSLPQLNINRTYNKKQTRLWLRQQGINPYDLSGADRRNIRALLNNNSVEVTQPTLKIPDYSDMLHNYALSLFVPSSRRGSKLIKTQDPVTKFRYKNGGSLNRIPFMLKGKDLPTAPKAEDRYKNGYKYGYRADGSLYLFPNPLYTIADVKGVRTDYPFMSNLGKIQRTIFYAGDNPMDTMYTEIPNSVFPVERKLRYADSKNKTPEYEILKHRFNTAWNLAK